MAFLELGRRTHESRERRVRLSTRKGVSLVQGTAIRLDVALLCRTRGGLQAPSAIPKVRNDSVATTPEHDELIVTVETLLKQPGHVRVKGGQSQDTLQSCQA